MAKLCLKTQKFAKVGYVFFYEDSLVSIELEKGVVKKANKDIKKKLKEDKVPLLQRASEKEQAWEDFGESLSALGKDEILSQYREAVSIEYRDIEKFKLTPYRKNVRTGGNDMETRDYLGEVSVKGRGGKIWYNHKYQKGDFKYEQAIALKESLDL